MSPPHPSLSAIILQFNSIRFLSIEILLSSVTYINPIPQFNPSPPFAPSKSLFSKLGFGLGLPSNVVPMPFSALNPSSKV
jgi:hypothetical protein